MKKSTKGWPLLSHLTASCTRHGHILVRLLPKICWNWRWFKHSCQMCECGWTSKVNLLVEVLQSTHSEN